MVKFYFTFSILFRKILKTFCGLIDRFLRKTILALFLSKHVSKPSYCSLIFFYIDKMECLEKFVEVTLKLFRGILTTGQTLNKYELFHNCTNYRLMRLASVTQRFQNRML